MFLDDMVLLYPATLEFAQWNPDQWVALVKTTVWPVFWTGMAIAWRTKIGMLLSAAIVVMQETGEISIGPVKVSRMKPEDVASVKAGDPTERYEWITESDPGTPGGRLFLLKEKLIRLP